MARRESGGRILRTALAGALAAVLLGPAAAQTPSPVATAPEAAPAPAPAASRTALTPAQLDRLTAPIALYPDSLVALILEAATYPLEIVEAARWRQQSEHAALQGDRLAAALAPLRWDPSVKSLAAFPQILAMLDKYLDWTEELGDAVLADQPAVMDSVQRLRRLAEATGGLASSPEETVSSAGGAIVIEPATPETVYVPVYDPNTAFGAWPYPEASPFYFPDVYASAGPWIAVVVVERLRPHHRCDWQRHRIDLDATAFGHPAIAAGTWQHDPMHRRGAAYRDPVVRTRFEAAALAGRTEAPSGFRPAAPPMTAHPPAVIVGRAPAPQVHVALPELARPPAVLRGSAIAPQTFRRTPEMPVAVRPEPTPRVSIPAPTFTAPGVAAHAPRFAPTSPIAPAPRVAPAPDGVLDRR